MNITAKIFLSFFSLLTLIAIDSYFDFSGMSEMGDNFGRYRQLALQTNASGQVLDNMLISRLNVKNYLIETNEENVATFEARAAETLLRIEALQVVVDTEAKKLISEDVHKDMDRYLNTFRTIVDLQKKRQSMVFGGLDIIGPQIEKNFTEIMQSAKNDGDVDAGYLAGTALRSLLLARLYVTKYLVNNDNASYNRVLEELNELTMDENNLLNSLKSPERIRLANSANKLIEQYQSTFIQVYQTISQRNKLVKNTLDTIGPEIALLIETLKTEVKAEQDQLGPIMIGLVDDELSSTLWMTAIAVLIALSIALYVSRTIAMPITNMTSAMEKISTGDLDVEIPGQSRSDEIGSMANTVQIFKDNAIRMKSNSAAIFGTLQSTTNTSDFCQEAIKLITPILNGGHGAFYTFDSNSKKLSLAGSYGYSDRKSLSNQFELGQSLIGQCALERQTISLTDIPSEYVKISSGLGDAVPSSIIATPVTHLDQLLGVIEIASFTPFDDTTRRILDELLSVLGLNMENIIRSERTAELLKQTKAQADVLTENEAELKASEEEMQASNEELIEKTRLLEKQAETLRETEEEARTTNEELVEKTRNLEIKQEELEEASEENARKAKELEETNRYKSEFLANMSHELRTPLNSLLILSKSLADNADGDLNKDNVEAAEIIHGSGSQLLGLINDILDLSKIEAGHVDTEIRAIDPRELALIAHRKFDHMAVEKNIKFDIEINDSVPDNFNTDSGKVDQIVTNLIGNAIKFTDQGSVNVKISSGNEAGSTTRVLNVEVTDTGCGIAADQQATVFEAFHQADGSTNRRFGGTGLGLSISRNLARLLDGEIAFSSNEGRGSVFTLTLNELESAKVVEGATISSSEEASPHFVTKNLKQLQRSKTIYVEDDRDNITNSSNVILVVDDDQTFATLLRNEIRERGISCVVCETGEDALSFCEQYSPKGIILDIGLPNMNGWEVNAELKKQARTRRIPVHFISASDEEKSSVDLGAIGYVQKPVSNEDIHNVLDLINEFGEENLQKILIVEDDSNSAIAIKRLIASEDIEMEFASTGEQAITMLESTEYDCVVLDLTLPDMDGIKILEKMAQFTEDSQDLLPVIVYSGRELETETIAQLKQYTDSIVVKGGRSPERLLEEVTLFLHSVKNKIPKESIKASKPDKVSFSVEKLAGKTVLIVDDDMRNTFALSRVLRGNDINVLMAESGQKSLNMLAENEFIDVVLMDVMMPGMDGYETTKHIRSQEKFRKLPIIALTAKAMKGDRERSLRAGMTSYMSKPIDIDKLLMELNRLIVSAK